MASAASLFMTYNSASRDDNATNLCVELQCLTTATLVDTTPPDVIFLLDLQPAQSESWVHCEDDVQRLVLDFLLDSLVLMILQVFRHSYDSALVLLRRFLLRRFRHGSRYFLCAEL